MFSGRSSGSPGFQPAFPSGCFTDSGVSWTEKLPLKNNRRVPEIKKLFQGKSFFSFLKVPGGNFKNATPGAGITAAGPPRICTGFPIKAHMGYRENRSTPSLIPKIFDCHPKGDL